MSNSESQSEVVEYYKAHCDEVATVGGYVRVSSTKEYGKTCFGPVKGTKPHGWKVVEIDWQNTEFLLAPEGYHERIQDESPPDRLDREHHNAPKDGNDDPVFEE